MKNIDKDYLDINGLVLPSKRLIDKPSDNGVLYTSVAIVLGFDFQNYKDKIKECFLVPGLMARWKSNDFDQAAWDDYLGVAVGSIYNCDTEVPRKILLYGFTHFFFFNTDKKLDGRDFLGRNVPIWGLMFAAAFPKLKLLAYPLLYLTQLFFPKPNLSDTSGTQLSWIFLKGCEKIGFKFKKLEEHESIIKDAMKIYYHKDHPFNKEI